MCIMLYVQYLSLNWNVTRKAKGSVTASHFFPFTFSSAGCCIRRIDCIFTFESSAHQHQIFFVNLETNGVGVLSFMVILNFSNGCFLIQW